MKTSARIAFRIPFLACALALALALPALSYQYPLGSTEIRTAYFIGKQSDQSAAEFYSRYFHLMPKPKKGPYVERLAIDTPYSQIAERSGNANLSAQDAIREFSGKPMVFRAYVQVFVNSVSPMTVGNNPGPLLVDFSDFWRDYKIKLIQHDRDVPAGSTHGVLLYPAEGDDSGGPVPPIGVRLDLEYDPAKLTPRRLSSMWRRPTVRSLRRRSISANSASGRLGFNQRFCFPRGDLLSRCSS